MGITHYGPVDGHDLGELDAFLRVAKEAEKPVLLHVVTEKGHGCDFCTDDPDGLWHGVGAFDLQSGRQAAAGGTTQGKAISTVLLALAVIGCTSLPKRLWEKREQTLSPALSDGLRTVWAVIVLLVSIAFLVGDSYNPFLYFRF